MPIAPQKRSRLAAFQPACPPASCHPRRQVRHLEAVQRTATANAVATKLLAATSLRAAGGQQQQQPQQPAFRATFDFKAALASSAGSFYPAIVLKH